MQMDNVGLLQGKYSTPIISVGFITMVMLVVLIIFMAVDENRKLADLNDRMYQHPFSVSIAVLEANGDILAMHRYMKDVVLAKNKDELDIAISLVDQHEDEVYRHFEIIKERFLGDKEKINVAYMTFVEWKSIRDEVLVLKRNNQHLLAADITTGKGAEHVNKLNLSMKFLIDFARSKALEFKDSSQRSYGLSKTSLYFLLIVTILSSGIIAFSVIFLVRKAEHSRNESEERFKAIFNNAEVSIWSEDFSTVVVALDNFRQKGVVDLKEYLYANMDLAWDLAGMVKVNSVNNATLKLFGANNQSEFLSKIEQTFGANAIDVFINEMCAIWTNQETFLSEANFQTLDGKEIKALISFQTPSSTNNFRNVPVSIVDISEQKSLEKKLKLSSRVFSDTHEGIVITDADRMIVDVNPAFSDITGYSREEVIGKSPTMLSSGKHEAEFYNDMWQQITEHGYWQGEIWNRRKNGEVYAELLTTSSLKDSDEHIVNYLGIFTDITHSKRQQESMRRMAHYDALTGLPNRTLLLDRFYQALAHSKRSDTLLAVCFLDLDDFKPVNDIFGHDIGDKLLIEVARRLELALRSEDTVSRLGGDEFSMLLGDLKSTPQCCEILERIIHSISATYFIDEHLINISASIGVSLSPLDGVELDTLLRQADQAMYQAKQEGKKNYQFFDLEQAQETTLRHVKLQEIQHALINHELCLYYQPKVNMASGKIIGVEALIRWQHPEKGLVPPLEFLPLIEGSEIEIQVGDWVIDQAMEQLERLNNQGINLEMSVNVSSMQFLNPCFFDSLKEALNRHSNIEACNFKLEVLESSTLGNIERISYIIRACCNELGVKIALDDFGTGYSSLSHLRQLPADTIKIDQSFVRDVLIDQNDFSIIDGVIGLTKSFNRHVIAEGVETTEHGLMLLLMGCHNAQGYAISKPMPANKLLDWIKEYQPNQIWIASSQEEMTLQVRRVKQLELILTHWLKNIENSIKEDSKEKIDICNMGCHFDKWIRRLRDDELFEGGWINELEQAYNVMQNVAKDIISGYQPDASRSETDALNQLHSVFDKTLSMLTLASTKNESVSLAS
ncbi:EAL domain-containing protein [Shewanella sp. KX20019]|uniref:EAL domain-containing protein n=1 Tax=Shewanella sp. KX20019 TaxID=2803864 RepID=UPI001925662A|nr:EAL domain-containing protein [Shewanella sp. KX20019]QQX79647.1 EAL domain-containing protein [Shewanella sp. KX20019]